jgi:hypothetical protein
LPLESCPSGLCTVPLSFPIELSWCEECYRTFNMSTIEQLHLVDFSSASACLKNPIASCSAYVWDACSPASSKYNRALVGLYPF